MSDGLTDAEIDELDTGTALFGWSTQYEAVGFARSQIAGFKATIADLRAQLSEQAIYRQADEQCAFHTPAPAGSTDDEAEAAAWNEWLRNRPIAPNQREVFKAGYRAAAQAGRGQA